MRSRVCMMLALLAPLAVFAPRTATAQWVPQESGTTAEFRGLSAVDSRTVWVSGMHGQVLHTTDAGAHWIVDTVSGASALDFRDVQGSNHRVAWVISSGDADQGQARIYRTTDAGRHWSLQYSTSEKGVFLDAIAFWDARHGIALSDPVEGHFVVLTTDDGGANWRRVPAAALPPNLPGEAAFAASGTCLTVHGSRDAWIATGGGPRARVFRTTDRGRSWAVADVPVDAGGASSGLFSIAFADATHGVAVGGDYRKPHERSHNVAITSDGGRTWRAGTGEAPAGYVSGVANVPGSHGTYVAVGLAGTAVSRDGGDSWSMVDSVAYNSVAFAARDVGWAVGPRGRIAVWRVTIDAHAPAGARRDH